MKSLSDYKSENSLDVLDSLDEQDDYYIREVIAGGLSLKHVPEEHLTQIVCMYVLTYRPNEIKYIPDTVLTKEMCGVVISSALDPDVVKDSFHKSLMVYPIQFIPEKHIAYEDWEKIVQINPLTIVYLPKQHQTKELLLSAVTADGESLRYVPKNRHSDTLCRAAISNNPSALAYVTKRFLNYEMSVFAVSKGIEAFPYTTDDYKILDNYLTYYDELLQKYNDNENTLPEQYDGLAQSVMRCSPITINANPTIIHHQLVLGLRYYTVKKYDAETDLFIISEFVGYNEEKERTYENFEYDTFHQFYTHLGGDMSGAELYDYDFEGVDASGLSLEEAQISSDTLYHLGIFDDTYYQLITDSDLVTFDDKYVGPYGMMDSVNLPSINEATHEHIQPIYFYYISDIHLDHKIKSRFPERATHQEIKDYVRDIITDMVSDIDGAYSKNLIVLGDVSSNFELVRLFYTELKALWQYGRIISVLGNHELWGYGLGDSSVWTHSEVIDKYRNLFNSLDIVLLENDLLVFRFDGGSDTYSEDELMLMTDEELSDLDGDQKLFFFGGVGYSGYNPNFNASHGIYRDTISTIEKDTELTNRFSNLYERLKRVLIDKRTVILSHTPKHDWSNTVHNNNWMYMYGHTHQNTIVRTDNIVIYADNQIGYDDNVIGLKRFSVEKTYNIYEYVDDGQYTIKRSGYLSFVRRQGISIEFNTVKGYIYMLKNKGLYMFLYEDDKTERLYLLHGGRKLKLEIQDIDYYYDNMVEYANKVEYHMSTYYQALERISNMVKRIGGTGKIHGCIVDIDYYNHIYLNPHDGKVAPYYTTSITYKEVYSDISSLLEEHRPDMLDKYLASIQDNELLQSIGTELTDEYEQGGLIQVVHDTSMYQPSNKILNLQYITDANIIRVWSDSVLEYSLPEQYQIESDTWRITY